MVARRITLALAFAACGDDQPSSTGGTTGASLESTSTDPSVDGTGVVDGSDVSSSGSDSSSGSTTLETSGGSFFVPIDHGSSQFQCDQFTQDCPPEQKCMPYASDGGPGYDATHCVSVAADPAQLDEPCTMEPPAVGTDDCDTGLICRHTSDGAGTCTELCTGSSSTPTCADPDQACVFTDGSGAIAICATTCDPLAQDCPSRGAKCIRNFLGADADWVCVPQSGVEPGAGAACESAYGCAAGHVCLGMSAFSECAGAGCCAPLCDALDPASDAACAALDPATSCEPWYRTPPPGQAEVGVCRVPGPA
jgi:hypothetical protein